MSSVPSRAPSPSVLKDAWTTLVPDLRGRHGPLPPLMLALTVATGLVDAFSYLVLGHVFVANMTGNVVFSAFALAGARGFSLAASVVALGAFVAGALVGGRTVHHVRHRGRTLGLALLTETVLITAAYLTERLAGTPGGPHVRYPLIVLLGVGLGVQNSVARALKVPELTTTVLTLTITGIAADSRAGGGTDSKAGRRVLSVLAMFLGALVGAVAVLNGHTALPLLVTAVLLAACTAAAFAAARENGPWTAPV